MKVCKIKGCGKKYCARGYCHFHYQRLYWTKTPLRFAFHGNKGKRNINWRGGVAEYPNHYLLKKLRIILLRNFPKCQICKKKPSTEIHHKSGNKSNHRRNNLLAVCHPCNIKTRTRPNKSKYRNLFGFGKSKTHFIISNNRLKKYLTFI